MLDLLTFAVAAFGVVYAITESTIFALPRILLASRSSFAGAGIYCARCTGFWVGVVLETLLTGDLDALGFSVGSALFAGAFTMGAITLLQGFAPGFLSGALEREQPIIAAWAARRGSHDDAHDDD